jgi:hypothetical protein
MKICPMGAKLFHADGQTDRMKLTVILLLLLLLFYWVLTTHLRVLASSVLRFQDHTQGCTTVGRTPLDE